MSKRSVAWRFAVGVGVMAAALAVGAVVRRALTGGAYPDDQLQDPTKAVAEATEATASTR